MTRMMHNQTYTFKLAATQRNIDALRLIAQDLVDNVKDLNSFDVNWTPRGKLVKRLHVDVHVEALSAQALDEVASYLKECLA